METAEELINEIENLMERWHLGRADSEETLQAINDVLYKNGKLAFFNKSAPIEEAIKDKEETYTKEDMKKCYEAGEDSKENEINGDGETDFEEWLSSTPKPEVKEQEWTTPCKDAGKCLENEAYGQETDICRDGCVQSMPVKEQDFKCQREIEGQEPYCYSQCEHCKEYFKPVKEQDKKDVNTKLFMSYADVWNELNDWTISQQSFERFLKSLFIKHKQG